MFSSPNEELTATLEATEELLKEISASGKPASEHSVLRLEKLATACARIAYSNGLASSLSDSVQSLITWCDHLDEVAWREEFLDALSTYPLRDPLLRT